MANNTTYFGGPGYGVWNSLTLKMLKEWGFTNPDQYFDIDSATGVGITRGIKDKMGKIPIQPKVFLANLGAMLSAFVPYTNPLAIGSLLRPASDLPFVAHLRNGGTGNAGLTLTAYAAMLTKMPKLTFAPDKPLFGDAELTFLQALGTNAGDMASLLATATASYTEPSFTPSNEYYDRYTFTLGALSTNDDPFTVITDPEGVEVELDATLSPVKPSQEPTRDFKLEKLTAKLRFRPWNMDADTWYATYMPETGSENELGQTIDQQGYQANIVGANAAGANALLPCVTRSKSGLKFSRKDPRIDKVELDVIQYNDPENGWQPLITLGVN
jgi:hypothetical protein